MDWSGYYIYAFRFVHVVDEHKMTTAGAASEVSQMFPASGTYDGFASPFRWYFSGSYYITPWRVVARRKVM